MTPRAADPGRRGHPPNLAVSARFGLIGSRGARTVTAR